MVPPKRPPRRVVIFFAAGPRAGTEIAEVYTSFPESAGEPLKRLIGWTRVALGLGESQKVSIPVSRDRLTTYDEATDSWELVPGGYTVMVGGSSEDLPLHRQVTLP
jgi:beta-glucosidase